jgi:hypothetical protein
MCFARTCGAKKVTGESFLLTDSKINLFLLKYIPVAKFIVVDWGRSS